MSSREYPARAQARVNAETSLEPDGLTRRVMLNILEAFFRRPWLYLLPFVLVLGLAIASVVGGTNEYKSVGTLSASNDVLLADLTEAGTSASGTWETPASVTSRSINELLRTQMFLRAVIERAELVEAVEQQPVLLDTIRASTGATPDGDFLVRVTSTTQDPELSQRLATATIDSYVQWVIDDDVGESSAAITFLEGQAAEADTEVQAARKAVDDYIVAENVSSLTDVPIQVQMAMDRLNVNVARAETRYNSNIDRLEEARLAASQARTVVDEQLRVVDPAEVPFSPQPRFKGMVLTVIMFAAIGLILSGGLVVLTAILDRTIRIPDDITAKFGLEVLAVVPNTRR